MTSIKAISAYLWCFLMFENWRFWYQFWYQFGIKIKKKMLNETKISKKYAKNCVKLLNKTQYIVWE